MKYQNFLIALTIVAIVASVFASTFSTTTSYTTPHNLNVWTSAVETKVIRTDGSIEELYMGPNNITNVGLQWVRDKIAFGTNASGVATTIVLGNGTNPGSAEDPAITTLAGQQNSSSCCGLIPTTATPQGVGNGNYSVSNLWTVTGCAGGNIVINTTALYNQTSNGCTGACLMFAGKNFSSLVTLQNGDQLNVTWYVWAASGG
jgi:hypothetical protein